MDRVWLCAALVLGACTDGTPSGEKASGAAKPTEPAPTITAEARETSAGPTGAAATGSDPALFERLGGLPAIRAVVDEFVGRTTTDPRIKERFFNTDPVRLKALLVEQVCAATGGPCKYTGRDMKSTHSRMELVEDEFGALVEDLVAALDKFHVPEREKGELLGALAGMKNEILAGSGQLRPLDSKRLDAAAKLASSLDDRRAAELVELAVVAGRRGQRSYAEQLFSRAELLVGPAPLASAAAVFRENAPPRVTTPTHTVAMNTAPQPKGAVGSSEEDAPIRPADGPGPSTLTGTLLVDGAPVTGMGVIMLEPTTGKFKRRIAKKRVIEQRDHEFAPHVLAVPVGSTVSFPNFDKIFHNVFSLSSTAPFDLGLYKSGETRDVVLTKEGVVRIGCNIHSAMAAFIIVVAAPHYVVAEPSGAFAFRRLQPGTYRMKVWTEHSAAPSVSEIAIRLGANQTTVDVKADATDHNPDKFGVARR